MKSGATSVVLGLAFAAGCGKGPSGPASQTSPHAGSVTITSLVAERSGDHLHLTIATLVKNPGTTPLTVSPPAVQLWIGKAKPAAPFIAPGLEPAILAPGSESEAATHWWLAASDLSGNLDLEIGGARQSIKSADAFDIELLPENQTVALQFPKWQTP